MPGWAAVASLPSPGSSLYLPFLCTLPAAEAAASFWLLAQGKVAELTMRLLMKITSRKMQPSPVIALIGAIVMNVLRAALLVSAQ